MSYQNSLRYAPQPALDLGFRQSLRRRKSFDLPGGNALWMVVSKYSVVIIGLMFCTNLVLSYGVHRTNVSIQNIEAQRHELQNEFTTLQAERDTLMSKNRVIVHAEAKLALVVPGELFPGEPQVRKL
jgi:cell division protein FtsL